MGEIPIDYPSTREEVRAADINNEYFRSTKYIQPKTHQAIYVASLYIAHILEGNPKPYQHFCDTYHINVKKIYKYVKAITLSLRIDISMRIEDRIFNVIKNSRESALIKAECYKLFKQMVDKKFEFRGNYMATVGALFYIVKNRFGQKCTLKNISERFSVDQSIIKKHRTIILDYI